MIGLVNFSKYNLVVSFRGADGRTCGELMDPGSNLPFDENLLPFQISNHTRKACIFNKNEGNVYFQPKLKIKYGVGLG